MGVRRLADVSQQSLHRLVIDAFGKWAICYIEDFCLVVSEYLMIEVH